MIINIQEFPGQLAYVQQENDTFCNTIIFRITLHRAITNTSYSLIITEFYARPKALYCINITPSTTSMPFFAQEWQRHFLRNYVFHTKSALTFPFM